MASHISFVLLIDKEFKSLWVDVKNAYLTFFLANYEKQPKKELFVFSLIFGVKNVTKLKNK